MPDVLILGGTGEARALAARLVDVGLDVLSSLAGRVASPRLPVGGVRIGGFGGRAGLADFLREEQIAAVVDATHPFAARITPNAFAAAADAAVPHLRLARAGWTERAGDRWARVASIEEAARTIRGRRVFLTTGRQDVAAFAGVTDAWFLIRVVDPPETALPPHHEVLRSRGPYTLDGDLELMRRHAIDTVVTKDSGGELTSAKLDAARALGLPVIVVDRPAEPAGIARVSSVDDAVAWVRATAIPPDRQE